MESAPSSSSGWKYDFLQAIPDLHLLAARLEEVAQLADEFARRMSVEGNAQESQAQAVQVFVSWLSEQGRIGYGECECAFLVSLAVCVYLRNHARCCS